MHNPNMTVMERPRPPVQQPTGNGPSPLEAIQMCTTLERQWVDALEALRVSPIGRSVGMEYTVSKHTAPPDRTVTKRRMVMTTTVLFR